jgi:two-component system LytT family response regulator
MPPTIKTLIVDDEPLARAALRNLLGGEPDVEVVGEAADGVAALDAIRRLRPDLLFLDVKMPVLSGLQMLEHLGSEPAPVVIFVTAFDRYAVQAFEAQALDYLLKPLTVPRFRAAVARARNTLARSASLERHAHVLAALRSLAGEGAAEAAVVLGRPSVNRIEVRVGNRVRWIPAGSIDWIEARRNHARLHVAGEYYLIRRTMGDLEEALDPRLFVRIHRTAIANRTRIREVAHEGHGEYRVLLADGTRLKLGRTYRHRLLPEGP